MPRHRQYQDAAIRACLAAGLDADALNVGALAQLVAAARATARFIAEGEAHHTRACDLEALRANKFSCTCYVRLIPEALEPFNEPAP